MCASQVSITVHYKTSQCITSHYKTPQGITRHLTVHYKTSQHTTAQYNTVQDTNCVKGDLRGVHLAACGRMFPLLSRGNWSHICIRHTHGQQPTIVPSQFALVFGLALVSAFSSVFVFVFTCVFTGRIVSLYLHLCLLAFSFVSAFVFTFVFTESKNTEEESAQSGFCMQKYRGRERRIRHQIVTTWCSVVIFVSIFFLCQYSDPGI